MNPAAIIAAIKAMDDYAAADTLEAIGKHFHGYDLNTARVAEQLREDASPRTNCDYHCDCALEERSAWGMGR